MMRSLLLLVGLVSVMAASSAVAQPASSTPAIVPDRVVPLFNGKDLSGWEADVPARDTDKTIRDSFIVRNGMLVSLGDPKGHLFTHSAYRDYRLEVEYRFPGKPGNCGVLIHASRPRALYKMFPQSVEVQMNSGDAGDFWVIQEDIKVKDMEKRRPRKEGEKWGGSEGDARRILNLTDGSEKPLGEWNTMVIEARGRTIKAWVNGDLVNDGFDATADRGRIALQAEGTEVEFRKVQIEPLSVATASAGEITVEGTIVCAKCTLNKSDAKACQNVLLAAGPDGKKVEYYVAPSKSADAVGEVCTESTQVTVTGTVSEKDGRKWITPSKVESRS